MEGKYLQQFKKGSLDVYKRQVLSSAYIQNPLSTAYSGFTGGSFQDLTRVARLNCDMWGELFDRNRDLLCQQLDLSLIHISPLQREGRPLCGRSSHGRTGNQRV